MMQCDEILRAVTEESNVVGKCSRTTTDRAGLTDGVTQQSVVSTKPTTANMTSINRATTAPPGESNDNSLISA